MPADQLTIQLVIVNENGTGRFLVSEPFIVDDGATNVALEAVNLHAANIANPHQTDLQQAVLKQGSTPVTGGVKIGSTLPDDKLLTLLKGAITMAFNGDARESVIDADGFHHTNQYGQATELGNNGITLNSGVNTISINYDGTITGLLESPLAGSAATRGYVESLALGLKPHAPARVMLDGDVDDFPCSPSGRGAGKTLTANSNGVFAFQCLQFSLGDRIGVKLQGANAVDAGIYTLSAIGSATTPWVLTRATDFDGSSAYETKQSDIIFAREGTYAKCMFIETQKGSEPSTGDLIIDTDPVAWELFHSPQDLLFEQGLQQTGQSVSVKPDITTGSTIIPVTVSTAGVGVQRSVITGIADTKKYEAEEYTNAKYAEAINYTNMAKQSAITECNALSEFLKSVSDKNITDTYNQTVTNDIAIENGCNNYASELAKGNETYINQQIAVVVAQISGSTNSKPMLYPRFFLLNGATIQNYSDYLYMDNAYRSGNDGGLISNNLIPFLVPKSGTLISISAYIGYVAVAGDYVANSVLNVNFELRQILPAGIEITHPFSVQMSGASDVVGSNGMLLSKTCQIAGIIDGLNVALPGGCMYGIKFIHNASGSPTTASAIKDVLVSLEILVG